MMKSKVVQNTLIVALGLLVMLFAGIPSHLIREELPPVVTAQIPGSSPAVCIGYNPDKDKWGYEANSCPANHAYYAVDDPAGIKGPGSKIAARGLCCQLPSKDILTKQHVFVDVSCPENHVATGAKNPNGKPESTKYLRCTKINTKRYQLSEMTPSFYWGDGAAGWQGSTVINRNTIPAGIRNAIGRTAVDHWDVDGCVGYPWGSLLAKKTSKFCGGLYFRQLQFKGRAGDPRKGTPVKMFADCDSVSDAENPLAPECISSQKNTQFAKK